ncbi:class 1a ribonucleoside-diphosphate reductase subunit alpha [Psychromonas sp. SP041]|uniref:class 1a ribonucleoside-diphosphate reductase subunit alpha n=1 Tax=Psychromonas sp. SP041 TaxID=1365007 RepID=UPI0010C7CDF8|nr:class 1a ribonucleoside-diphosphate reductase subunit alpha [Psychromonas sp. SP041]
MIQKIKVTKRNGVLEDIDYEKIHRVISWAAEGLKNVSVSNVELKANIQFYDGISTCKIQETIIKSAADLISVDCPDYQFLSANLAIIHIRKQAFGRYEAPKLLDHVKKLVAMGKYDKEILEKYTESELNEIDSFIDHNRDHTFSYAAVKQLEGKYLVQNRVKKEIYESPQFIFALVSAILFAEYKKPERLIKVRQFYDATSKFKISLPTPIMSGLRTPSRQFSSCVLIESGDSLNSINATSSSIVRYVSQRSGIGINAGRIRALGSEIRGGEAFHTGVIPFYKYFQAAVKCCYQGGVRGGAATVFYPIWHLESPSLLVLKNNRGVDENRVRHLDYGVQINKTIYKRLLDLKNITLFSPHDVPDLYDAFFEDQDLFEELYVKYENDPTIRKESIPALEIFSTLMGERSSTGRIYIQNVDHCNTHSPFDPKQAPIRQSNLCLEIALPTKPLDNINDVEGEIALCTLSAINLGQIETLADLEILCELSVRALDSLLDYQDYPVAAAEASTMARRTLGIGTINLAYYLAKNNVKYSDGSANQLVHETYEAIQYYLLKASNKLAQEVGACPKFNETTYSQGLLPIDTYKKEIDAVGKFELLLDWEALREDIKLYGLRNSTLTALMPSETSSQISNATNGIEPPRGFVSVKASKDGILKQVVPGIEKYKDNYELLWSIPNNKGYLALVGIMQKFVDQSISANTNYDPSSFEDNKVPMKLLLGDLILAYKYGLKTLYYHNTRDQGGSNEEPEEVCEGGACVI